MNEGTRVDSQSFARRTLAAILACGGMFGLFFLLRPPVVWFALSPDESILLWPSGLICALRVQLIVLAIGLSAGALLARRRLPDNAVPPWLSAMMPLVLMPFGAAILLLGDLLPPGATSAVVLFLPPLVVSMALAPYATRNIARPTNGSSREWGAAILVVSVIFYASIGIRVALVTGEHVGDEGHYLIQARSLAEDGDLDLRNNLGGGGEYGPDYKTAMRAVKLANGTQLTTLEEQLTYMHITTRSRNGRWHSWHPFGLSLLLAPLHGLGMIPRYILLALVGALGNLAIYLTARRIGASRNSSLVATGAFGVGFYWTIYSGRALPEALGATLLAWIFWCVASQERRPWPTVFVAAAACGYLPFVHDRFLAASLMGFGFYGLFGLFARQTWPAKLGRLAVFTALCAAGYAAFVWSQHALFQNGLKFNVDGSFVKGMFGYPLGMWGVLAGWRGVTAVMPAFPFFAAAVPVAALAIPRARYHALAVGVTFLACLVTSCAHDMYTGGQCVPGRYILIAIPMLVPCAAVALERRPRPATWLLLFLAGWSLMLTVLTLVFLPEVGRGFILPFLNLKNVHPALAGLFDPHASFMYPYGGLATQHHLTAAYVLLLALASVVFMTMRWRVTTHGVVILICVLTGAAAHSVPKHDNTRPFKSHTGPDALLPRFLASIDTDDILVKRGPGPTTNLLDISRMTFRDFVVAQPKPGITTTDLGLRQAAGMLSQPRIEKNDWSNRADLAWTTLTDPRTQRPARGWRILHIEGVVTGNVRPVLAIREGSHTAFEDELPVSNGVLNCNVAFYCRGSAGDLYHLARLEGEGSLQLSELAWTPFPRGLVDGTGIEPPEPLLGPWQGEMGRDR